MSIKHHRILVVDDSLSVRRLITILLSRMGYRHIVEASDGVQAHGILRTGRFDLVVTDWYMPNCNGIDLIHNIRKDSAINTIPILMVTAEADNKHISAALKAGANRYLTKPFTVASFNEVLGTLIG